MKGGVKQCTRLEFSLIIGASHKFSVLASALEAIESCSLSLSHLESRRAESDRRKFEFFVTGCARDRDIFEHAVNHLQPYFDYIKIVNVIEPEKPIENPNKEPEDWFPRSLKDLDNCTHRITKGGEELESDHPGFHDPVYIKRRKEIAEIAATYKHDQPIPLIKYTEEEIKTWDTILGELTKLYPTHACDEYNRAFELMAKECGFKKGNVPQLQIVSEFLKSRTGFTLRPVAGLLSQRDFLNGLAFRVFHSTQYIRHSSNPMYTPEPDVCHELLGHTPLFLDPDFADFSQEIGLASLGASDEDIQKLGNCYWYTVEFGLYMQNNERKAYGAGLLSSFGELQYCMTAIPDVRKLDLDFAAVLEFPVTSYQPLYFIADSFKDVKEKMRAYARRMCKKYAVKYNEQTKSIEVYDNKDQFSHLRKKEFKNQQFKFDVSFNKSTIKA